MTNERARALAMEYHGHPVDEPGFCVCRACKSLTALLLRVAGEEREDAQILILQEVAVEFCGHKPTEGLSRFANGDETPGEEWYHDSDAYSEPSACEGSRWLEMAYKIEQASALRSTRGEGGEK